MKGRFIIVGAGSVAPSDLNFEKQPGDLICAADAGFLAINEAGLKPDLVIGDFDSMAEKALFEAYGGNDLGRSALPFELLRLPVEKDDTDTVFCIREGFRRGYRDFVIYGGLGGSRLSHTVANLQLLTMIRDLGGQGELVFGDIEVFLLGSGDTKVFPTDQSGHFSVFSLSEESDVSLSGFYYPLDHGLLTRRFPLGVSNHFTGQAARITVHRGEVLVITEQ